MFAVIVNMDKNIPAAGGELPPVQLTFVPEGGEGGDAAEVMGDPEGQSASVEHAEESSNKELGPGAKKLQAAGKEVMSMMGHGDDEIKAAMKPKAAIALAADAFQSAGKKGK